MKKGISAVVAVIMLLMITVALVGMAYVWLSSAFTGVTKTTGEAIEKRTETIITNFVINGAWNETIGGVTYINISLQNIGTTEIPIESMSVMVNGIDAGAITVVSESQTVDGALSPNEKATISVSKPAAVSTPCGAEVEVKYASVSAIKTIEC